MDQWIREHYKSKGDFGMKTLDSRRSATLINRKEQRNSLLGKFRNIPESMSPLRSPMPPKVEETKVEKTAPKKQEAGTNKRIEMLKKWKEERERKKLEAKKKAKPIFKVFHVEHNDNLEDIYNNIKGKPIKLKEKTPLQFSENENISQFKFNQPETKQIFNSNKATATSKSGTGKRVLTNRYENSQNSTTSKVPKTTSKNISNGTSTVQNNKTKSQKNSEDKQGKGVKSKLQIGTKLGSNKMSSDHARNGDKKNLPIEKRRKGAARKEFEKRKSLNGSMLNTCVSCKTDPRSPKAAAGYFTRKLNMEIARIQSLCSVWQSYKDEGNLSEDACGLIDMTIGQSNLLISKKFNQFRGLIEQCLANEDLHGFWDMYKQVSDLDKRFENLEDMKRNNWLEEAPRIKTPKVAVKGEKEGKAEKASKASSILKETILAARRNREKQTKSEGEIEILIATKEKTPRRKSMSKDYKELNTPGRGILKSTNIESEKRKTVVFLNLRESTGSVKNSPISSLAVKGTPIPSRRSARISMNQSKLTFE